MSQENIQTDTPQEASNNEAVEYKSLEEAVFGEGSATGNIESAFTTGNEGNEQAAPQEQPQAEQVGTPAQEMSNDEKRYQYWQSTADKLKNENESLRRNLANSVRNQPQQPQEVPQEYQSQQPVEEFPAPPDKPQRPRVFNREEAYADPNSDSARYLDEMEDWRDNMTEYNTLKGQYQQALMEDKIESMRQERVREAQQAQAMYQRRQQANQIKQHVMGAHGMTDSEANDFIATMSDPKSITIDNLAQLYRMKTGAANPAPQPNPQPSADFQQVQRAQQVPSPMGVMPSGQSNVDNRSVEDKIMDTMIGNFNNKNPWK
tara:strand:+ start:922 stop:1875 length:954 start_codon:yes stop_codon:yes gene_type:complete